MKSISRVPDFTSKTPHTPHAIRLCMLFAALAISACTSTKQDRVERDNSAWIEHSARGDLQNKLKNILAILQVDMGIDGHLRSLPAIEQYIKEKLQKRGIHNPDVHAEIDYSPIIGEDGSIPFLSVVIGDKNGSIATSAKLGTADMSSNTWLRNQICKNFLAWLKPELEKICSFIEENKFDEEAEEALLDIYFEKQSAVFRQHGMLVIGGSIERDTKNNSYHVLIDYMNPLTGKVEIVKMQLSYKGKQRRMTTLV